MILIYIFLHKQSICYIFIHARFEIYWIILYLESNQYAAHKTDWRRNKPDRRPCILLLSSSIFERLFHSSDIVWKCHEIWVECKRWNQWRILFSEFFPLLATNIKIVLFGWINVFLKSSIPVYHKPKKFFQNMIKMISFIPKREFSKFIILNTKRKIIVKQTK